jgi:predicted membrane protein
MHKGKPCLHIFKLREYWTAFLEVSCYKSRCLQHKLQGEFVYFLFACLPWFLFVGRWTRTFYFHEVPLFIWNICIWNTDFIKIVQSTFQTSVYGAYQTKYNENKCWHFRQNEFRIARFEVTEAIRGTTLNSINLNCLKQSFTFQTHMLYDNHSHDDNSVRGGGDDDKYTTRFRF